LALDLNPHSQNLTPNPTRNYSNTASSTTSKTHLSHHLPNYTLAALEKALQQNPQHLLYFSATRDFSVENILFLLAVQDFKDKWSRIRSSPIPEPKPEVLRRLWMEAVEIYAFGVSEKYAEFPVNVEGRVRRVLDGVFEGLLRILWVKWRVEMLLKRRVGFQL
jgi:hypothetical protein